MRILVSSVDIERLSELKRIAHKAGHELVEAANGLDALDLLTREPVDAIMVDERLPLMGAVEMLSLLREAQEYRHLPVTVFSDSGAEQVIRRLVELGVNDIILTPLAPARFSVRIESVLESLKTARPGADEQRRRMSGRPAAQQTALIADGDAEYCALFEKAAGTRCQFVTAASGAKALEICRTTAPTIVFVGSNLGIIGRDRLAAQLRSQVSGAVRVVAIAQKTEIEAVRATGLFDDVMARTYVPATVARDLGRMLHVATPFGRLTGLVPSLRTTIVSAAEQTFGLMLKTDIEPVDEPPSASDRFVGASMVVTNAPLEVTFRVLFTVDSGRQIAAAFLESDAASLGEDDVLSIAGELANVLGGRLLAAFRQRKPGWEATLPSLEPDAQPLEARVIQDGEGTSLYFRGIDKDIAFQVDVTAQAGADADSAKTPVTMVMSDGK